MHPSDTFTPQDGDIWFTGTILYRDAYDLGNVHLCSPPELLNRTASFRKANFRDIRVSRRCRTNSPVQGFLRPSLGGYMVVSLQPLGGFPSPRAQPRPSRIPLTLRKWFLAIRNFPARTA